MRAFASLTSKNGDSFMRDFTVFCGANFGRRLIVSKTTNMAARPDLIDAVTAIPVTISEIFEDSLNYLVVNQKNEDLDVVIGSINPS